MGCADKYYSSTLDNKKKLLKELKPKFEKDKVILEYLLNEDKDKLKDYSYRILETLIDKTGNKAGNYNGRYIVIYPLWATIEGECRRVEQVISLENDEDFKLLYTDGPVTKLLEVGKLSSSDLYNLAINVIDNFIKDTENSIEEEEIRYLEEERREKEINSFHEHW